MAKCNQLTPRMDPSTIIGFSRSGLTIACFSQAGNVDVLNEQFIIEAMTGDRTSEHCLTSHVGAGSSSQCLFVARRTGVVTLRRHLQLWLTGVPKVSSGETSRASTVGWPAAAVDARSLGYGSNFSDFSDFSILAENGLRTAPDGWSSAFSRCLRQ